ncbi:MAG: hypothetical protein HY340_00885 [Candidatus Kerfeldbacteria bacterium]|nr:hypothetical protein [Candidatus Kerfeldbacteria bacterium]
MNPEPTKKMGAAAASAWSAGAAVVLLVALTIIGDLYAPLKDWLKATFTHHWIGKGVLGAAFYVVGLWLLRSRMSGSDETLRRGLWFVFWMALLGTLALAAFFLYEAFGRG